jgi:hypothetical protein
MGREGGSTAAGTGDASDWPRGVAASYPASRSGLYSPPRPLYRLSRAAAIYSLIHFSFLYPHIVTYVPPGRG